jgi:hypothetical protein
VISSCDQDATIKGVLFLNRAFFITFYAKWWSSLSIQCMNISVRTRNNFKFTCFVRRGPKLPLHIQAIFTWGPSHIISCFKEKFLKSACLTKNHWNWLGYPEFRMPLMPFKARIGSPGPGRFSYFFRMIPKGLLGAWITGNPHTTQPLINQLSCTGEHVEIKVIRSDQDSNPGSRTQNPLILGRTS